MSLGLNMLVMATITKADAGGNLGSQTIEATLLQFVPVSIDRGNHSRIKAVLMTKTGQFFLSSLDEIRLPTETKV